MPRALAKIGDLIIAETEVWETVEDNIYFPISAIKDPSILQHSDRSTFCSWKGHASYWHLNLNGEVIENAAWYYQYPYDAAAHIKDHVAFYKDRVEVVEDY
ncbi:hypothetical protein ASPWEDRAFT_171305 [Aspergillus wentii DTO 134E9]|uniref:DUF427 domain-containing protein n=1 Tax=Aspergillus wentii DTO 134E9 TaxID=1073089 RepID=A0A1L9RSH3_ASPWE|nr:uncharacterized protein ASPWEDRAFT_171305 [Aspergillus wentii DTO 134E9]KAI9930681.1 hypothetical protein MW887_011436 [Aspergillus wentii]OJJ37844.1 hypothetical protein ASPWEDRAFT_171305 [Aspergillus wentii DTO 134E9]